MIDNLCKLVINAGGSLYPLIIPASETNGYGLCNPSILNDADRLLVNIRNVRYTLHYCENQKKFHSGHSGPLQYQHPESVQKLITTNFLCTLASDFSIDTINKINTSGLDVEPMWDFVGLEDIRLVQWDNTLYGCGVRRDTTTHGEGRIELSKIINNIEVERHRINIPEQVYCEKNWMPIIDMPFHFIQWANPLKIVKVDLETNTSELVITKPESILIPTNLRGGSQIIFVNNYYIGIVHDVVNLYNPQRYKDALYSHRFMVWDKDWELISISDTFNFMTATIEFACGITYYNNNILVTFGFQDNAAYMLNIPIDFLFNELTNTIK